MFKTRTYICQQGMKICFIFDFSWLFFQFSYNICIYFHLICSTTLKRYFSPKPRLCVMLLGFDWSISFKAVYSVTVQKRHLEAKNKLAFSFRPMRKHYQVGGGYANVWCWRQTGIGLKTTPWFRESTRRYLYTRSTFRFNTDRCFHSHPSKKIIFKIHLFHIKYSYRYLLTDNARLASIKIIMKLLFGLNKPKMCFNVTFDLYNITRKC